MSDGTASRFEILDHPADMGFRASARDLKSLFSACADALTAVLIERTSIELREKRDIEVAADDLEYLLYNFLSELLYLFDAEGLICKEICVSELTGAAVGEPMEVRARLGGERFDEERHRVETYVKAITLHQLSVREVEGGFEAAVYLDI